MPVLDFHLTSQPDAVPADDGQELSYLRVIVEPRIDGERLFAGPGYLFDASALLTAGVVPEALDLFTCSCGIAGCAGIDEESTLSVTEQAVTWTFPAEPFAQAFRPGLPLALDFGRAQYEAALAKLTQDMETLRRESGLPVLVMPVLVMEEADLEEGRLPFPERLELYRARRDEWAALSAADADTEHAITEAG